MSDPQQPEPPAIPPEPAPLFDASPSPPQPEAQAYPFWSYSDVLIFVVLALPCMLLADLLVRAFIRLFHLNRSVAVAELIPAEFLGYGFLFGALLMIFRVWYNRPFWRSLGWTDTRLPLLSIVIAGIATAVGVAMVSALIHLPDTSTPMMELMNSSTAVTLMAIFGVTVAPICEELAFRGFLQPLLVRSLGAAPGILAASVPFGLLHFQEYGNSWKHVLLISLAGAAFGCMRHFSGSTKASAIMHASYNSLFFLVLLSDRKDLPHALW